MPKSRPFVVSADTALRLGPCLECAAASSHCGFWNEHLKPSADNPGVVLSQNEPCTCSLCARRLATEFASRGDTDKRQILRALHRTSALERKLFAQTRTPRTDTVITHQRVPVLYLRQIYRDDPYIVPLVFCPFGETVACIGASGVGRRALAERVFHRRAELAERYQFSTPDAVHAWHQQGCPAAPESFFVWSACALRVVVAYDRMGSDPHTAFQLQLFADTHLDLMTYMDVFEAYDDRWAYTPTIPADSHIGALGLAPVGQQEPPVERFFPHPLRAVSAGELADLTACVTNGNVWRDVRPKAQDEISACVHVLLSKTQNHKCTCRGFETIVCDYVRRYPALQHFLMDVLELCYLGNYDSADRARFRPLWMARKAVRRTFHFDRIRSEPDWCEQCGARSRTETKRGERNWCPYCPQYEPQVWCSDNCGQFTDAERGIDPEEGSESTSMAHDPPFCRHCNTELVTDVQWAKHKALMHRCDFCAPRPHGGIAHGGLCDRPHRCSFCQYISSQSMFFFYAVKEFYVYQVECNGLVEDRLVRDRKWLDHKRMLQVGMDEARAIFSGAYRLGGAFSIDEMRLRLHEHLLLVHHCNKPTVCKLLKGSFQSIALQKMDTVHNALAVDDHDTRPQRSEDFLAHPGTVCLRTEDERNTMRQALIGGVRAAFKPFTQWASRLGLTFTNLTQHKKAKLAPEAVDAMADRALAAAAALCESLGEWTRAGYTVAALNACACAAVDMMRTGVCQDGRLPLAPLRWCGMSKKGHRLLQRLYFNYEVCDMPDNDIRSHLVEIFRHRRIDFHLAHHYFMRVSELDKECVIQLPLLHTQRQVEALRMRYHISPWDHLPPSADLAFYCHEHEFWYSSFVEPIDSNVKEAAISVYEQGVTRPQYNYRTGKLYCAKESDSSIAKKYRGDGLLDDDTRLLDASKAKSVRKKREQVDCHATPLRAVHMLGVMRRVGKHIYALCCICGGMCEVDDGKMSSQMIECTRHLQYDAHVTYMKLQEFSPPSVEQVMPGEVRQRIGTQLGKRRRIMDAFVGPMQGQMPLAPTADTQVSMCVHSLVFDHASSDRRYLPGAAGSGDCMLLEHVQHQQRLEAVRAERESAKQFAEELERELDGDGAPQKKQRRRARRGKRAALATASETCASLFAPGELVGMQKTQVPLQIYCAFCHRKCERNAQYTRLCVQDMHSICVSGGGPGAPTPERSGVLVYIYLCVGHFRFGMPLLRRKPLPTALDLFESIIEEKQKDTRRKTQYNKKK